MRLKSTLVPTIISFSCLITVQIYGIQDASGKRIVSNYERIKQIYPELSTGSESSQWRSADKGVPHPCRRQCVEQTPMTCYYYMVVHYDDTMSETCKRYLQSKYRYKLNGKQFIDGILLAELDSHMDDCKYADGLESQVLVVNGQLPGQAIEVCYGDTIVADVINSLHETTTIHWHGIHQRLTPHMDGVPHVTQYPIEAGQAFRYRFEVDHMGTNWWHSHTEHQRAYGLAGPLIVRQPDQSNAHSHLYDFDLSEHVIMIQDWVNNFDESVAENILVNGRGRNLKKTNKTRPTLYSYFSIIRGGRYRFRAIFNGVSNCPISLSIDNHDLEVIASDGNDVEPVVVQKIMFHGAERFDFVLHANQEIANYWIRIKGYSFCAKNQLHQEAVLHYQDANPRALDTRTLSYAYDAPGIMLNQLEDDIAGSNRQSISLALLNSLYSSFLVQPSITFYTSMNAYELRGEGFRFQMDDITFSMPKMSLLQTRNLGIGQLFCNSSQQADLGFNCRQRHCKCSNVIHVPAYRNVEFVISSKSNTPHPIHLHGYTFRVAGMGVLDEARIGQIEEIDRRTPFPRRGGGPLKDSVQVPAFGYTIIRFYTDSPGYWMYHCHISPHSENGMAAVVRVGEDLEMKMCPVSNCGLCSSVA